MPYPVIFKTSNLLIVLNEKGEGVVDNFFYPAPNSYQKREWVQKVKV